MTDKSPDLKKSFTADWFMRGALTRIGDTIDSFMGRRWTPSSSLATSELIERLKKLLDAEAKQVPGKGTVVPHNIKLKMQWDKFSTDAEDALSRLETELLAAAADHINDKLYYTSAPLTIKVTRDYFVEGVKLNVGIDDAEDNEAELNVTMPLINIKEQLAAATPAVEKAIAFRARFEIKGVAKQKMLNFPAGGRLSIGRTGGSDLILDDISVSKIHASIAIDADGHLSVADTGSTNGTFINGQRISYGTASRLVEGDKVKFGEVEVEFELVTPVAIEDPIGDDDGAVDPDLIGSDENLKDEPPPSAEATFEIQTPVDDNEIPPTISGLDEDSQNAPEPNK
jgi:pSer/pThr/pTyr-binding forkhead associated (FHA) protein